MLLLKQLVKKIFQSEAKLVLKIHKPKIIAITGSVGKTLTKDILYNLLSKKFFIRKSEKSFTTELGVPLTILGCSNGRGTILDWTLNIFKGLLPLLNRKNYPEWLILEIDGDKPGDIAKVSSWIKPDILVVTAIGEVPSHVEFFGSDIEAFLNEKRNLINSLNREGVIFYNADDEFSGRLVEGFDYKKISCGLGKDCDISGGDYSVISGSVKNIKIPTGMSFEVSVGGEKLPVTIMETIGISNEYAVLLSCAVANHLGVPSKDFSSVLNKIQISPGHMKIIPAIKDAAILDDSYNSSPEAVKQSVEAVSKIENSGRKIVVLGDMLELGRFSSEEHRKIGRILKDVSDFCIFVGLRTRKTTEELLSLGFKEENIYSADTAEEAGQYLQDMLEAGDVVLVKGSQDMRMERVVEEVMRHPEDKIKLLVRQGEEWVER